MTFTVQMMTDRKVKVTLFSLVIINVLTRIKAEKMTPKILTFRHLAKKRNVFSHSEFICVQKSWSRNLRHVFDSSTMVCTFLLKNLLNISRNS